MIENIVHILKSNNIDLNPCSKEEISNLEKKFNVQFPKCYIEFLEVIGKGAGPFMEGSFCFYDKLELIQSEAEELLQENKFKECPKNAFVFWLHQGYQFAFFLINEGDNPSVYYYNETLNQEDFIKTYERLSDFYYDELINSGLKIPTNFNPNT